MLDDPQYDKRWNTFACWVFSFVIIWTRERPHATSEFIQWREAYLGPCKTSMMELFANIMNGL